VLFELRALAGEALAAGRVAILQPLLFIRECPCDAELVE
jgi:hypothetical protein